MPQNPANQSEHRVRDIMTAPVHSVDMDDSILNVQKLFERERCHHVVIMKNRRAYGVVSDRDILKVVSPFVGNKMMERPQDLNTLKIRIHQVMSRNLITITPDESITKAAEKMLRERVSCLPVMGDNGSVVGIVTVRDFVKWFVGVAGEDKRPPGELGQEEGILIIIDSNRCYSPNAVIARQIREAERLYDVKNDAGSARAKRLPMSPGA